MFQTKIAEKLKTYIFCLIHPSSPLENYAIYEIVCKSTVEPHRPQIKCNTAHAGYLRPQTYIQNILKQSVMYLIITPTNAHT